MEEGTQQCRTVIMTLQCSKISTRSHILLATGDQFSDNKHEPFITIQMYVFEYMCNKSYIILHVHKLHTYKYIIHHNYRFLHLLMVFWEELNGVVWERWV